MTLKYLGLSLQKSKRAPSSKYELHWRFFEPGAFPYHVVPKSTPLMVEDNIFMGTEAGKMICIDRHAGKRKWYFDVETSHPKGIWSSPTHHDGRIYFGAYDGNVYCLNALSGALIWKNPCCELIGSSPLIVPDLNMMFLGLEHHRPRQIGSNAAFDLKSSNRIWERGQQKNQHGSAAYSKKIQAVIFGNADHYVTTYSAQTGDICYTSPLIYQGKVFTGSGDRHMYIIDAKSGSELKKHNCHARVYFTPRILGGAGYFWD